jgi:L-iditol 2-dehydrogenase
MRAVAKVRHDERSIEIVERQQPTPSENEALLEVDFAGLCGSDAGIYAFESAYDWMSLPRVIGHEYAGRVVEVGEEVTKVGVGDRVAERPIRHCEDCYLCEIGATNVCQNSAIRGVHHDGAYAPYVAVPEDALHPIPGDVPQRHAAVLEPTSVAVRAVVGNSRVSPGDRVLVEGPGPIGLLTAQVAAARGGDVLISGVEQDAAYRLPLASDLGFETIDVSSADLGARRDAMSDGVGFDVVFDTTGHPSGLTTAAEAVRNAGQVVLIGQTGETTMEYSPLVRSEVDLQCSYASQYEDFERALRLMDSSAVDCETFVDDGFSLTAPAEAFDAFLAGETCKPVFDVGELRE